VILRALLAARFHLATRTGEREQRVYVLLRGRGGFCATASGDAKGPEHPVGVSNDSIALSRSSRTSSLSRLTIPNSHFEQPHRSSPRHRPSGACAEPDRIEGQFDLTMDLEPAEGSDTFILWQRPLQDRLGLKFHLD
jgi:uncharacterized protein (TIGR03435 family)